MIQVIQKLYKRRQKDPARRMVNGWKYTDIKETWAPYLILIK